MAKLGLLAALGLGLGYQAFGACTVVYSNYTLNSDVYGCFEIYGPNVVFNGNGHRIIGTGAQTSDKIIAVKGYNVTVKNADIDCNTKLTGIDVSNAGNSSRVDDIRIRNCTYGIRNTHSGLDITGKSDGGSNMLNNFMDVVSIDPTANHTYTYYLDGFNNGSGYGVYTATVPYYDGFSIFYNRSIGMIASANTFFWLNYTQFTANTKYDLYLYNVPTAYLTHVLLGSTGLLNVNSKVVKN
jgi:hypothetical protein